MYITEREKTLILNGLHMIESQCHGDELHYEVKKDLGGTPDPKEIRKLMNRIKKLETRSTPDPEIEKLTIAARSGDDAAAKKLIKKLAEQQRKSMMDRHDELNMTKCHFCGDEVPDDPETDGWSLVPRYDKAKYKGKKYVWRCPQCRSMNKKNFLEWLHSDEKYFGRS